MGSVVRPSRVVIEDQQPLTPALSQREREPTELSPVMHRPERSLSIMDSVKHDQVGVPLKYPPFSPLSLWERVRVRGSSRYQTPI
jgi:hypothetical protein